MKLVFVVQDLWAGKPSVGLRPLTLQRRGNLLSKDSEDMMKFGHTKLRAADTSVEKRHNYGKLRVYSEASEAWIGWRDGLGKGDKALEVKLHSY